MLATAPRRRDGADADGGGVEDDAALGSAGWRGSGAGAWKPLAVPRRLRPRSVQLVPQGLAEEDVQPFDELLMEDPVRWAVEDAAVSPYERYWDDGYGDDDEEWVDEELEELKRQLKALVPQVFRTLGSYAAPYFICWTMWLLGLQPPSDLARLVWRPKPAEPAAADAAAAK